MKAGFRKLFRRAPRTRSQSPAPELNHPAQKENPPIATTTIARAPGGDTSTASSSKSPRSLRISCIPVTISYEEFRAFLEDYSKETQPSNILAFSLALDTSQDAQVCTVCFRQEPKEFAACVSGSRIRIFLNHDGEEHKLIVDCDFIGMTCLHSCRENIIVDIVAVTGLAGHALGSWKSQGDHLVWLRDFLPEDIRHSRIFTYGYQSKLGNSTNNCSIQDYAKQFLNSVHAIRPRDEERRRPIILIGHSLGGLVIVQSLCYAKQPDWKFFESIASRLAAVYLFGTPFGGLDHEELVHITKGSPNNRLIYDLMPDSHILRLMTDNFISDFVDHDVLIVSFYETQTTVVTKRSESGELVRGGARKMMVNRESATKLSRSSNTVPFTGNHSSIVKFPHKSDEQYKIVVYRLDEGVSRAKEMSEVDVATKLEENSSRINQILDEVLPKRYRAVDADYGSRRLQHDSQCLENTRVELLKEIVLWSESFDGPSIYWLNGMAGTGKSTVAHTVAKYCQDLKRLGASFFFTRGQDGLSNAERFITTIAYQLARRVPNLATHMCEILRRDPDILETNLGDQWKSLIFQPLQVMGEISQPMPLVIIVDALDECEGEKDVRLLIHLLSTIEELPRVRIRVLITSRPESTIRQAFKRLEVSTYHNVVLHELPKDIVERDIATYLRVQLESIRSDKGIDHAEWLDESEIQGLVQRANGLFIYVSTVCLVLRNGKSGLRERLLMVLEKESVDNDWQKPLHTKYLDKIYTQALQQVLLGCDEFDLEYLPKTIREIVGTVCLLFTPLGAQSLQKLLHRSQGEIDMVLDNLSSVLTVPTGNDGGLIRLLHPSFRDFLVDSDRCNDSRFHVDAKQTHQSLFYSCLNVMEGSLKKDMCNLRNLGPMTATEKVQISGRLIPAEVQYACRYWAHHLQHSKYLLCDDDIVHNFLLKHFLHWLEALSLVDMTIEAVHTVLILEGELKNNLDGNGRLSAFIYDAKRFIFSKRGTIEDAPLQTYVSALAFSPQGSLIRRLFHYEIPAWVKGPLRMEVEWSPNFLTLDINSQTELAFSPDGQILVSSGGPNNMVVRLWDPNTGALLRTLEGHSESVLALAFSPDGKILASCSCDQTVRLWDLNTEASLSLEVLEGPSDNSNTSRESSFNAVLAFSPDGKILASSYIGGSIRLWDPNTGASIRTLEGHSYGVKILAFSPNGDILASVGVLRLSCTDRVIRLWNPNSGALLRILESHPYGCPTLLFSPDGNILASGSCDSVRAWDPYTGALLGVANLDHDQLDGDTMAFSPSGNILASNTIKNSICLLESDTGVLLGILEGHCEAIITLVFSPNEKLLASSSADGTIRLWDLNTKALLGVHESHSREPTALASTPQKNIHPFGKSMDHWGSYVTLEFSPSGKILASTSFDNTVRLWDPNTGFPFQIIQSSLFDEVGTLAFSPDEKVLAFSFNCRKILLWDLNTETSLGTLEGHSDMVATLAFAPDGKILASGSYDKAIRLWDVRTNARLGTLEGQFYKFSKLVFSPDGKILASGSYDKTVQLWDVRTNTPLGTLEGHSADIVTLAFSPNGKILASEYEDQKVRMWDLSTKAPLGTVDGCFDGIRALSCTPDVKALYMNSPSFGFSISTDNVSFMTRHGKIYITPKASTDNQRLDHLRPELWGARHNWIFYAQHKIISIPRDFWCDDEEFVVYDNVLAWSDERYRVHIMHLDIPMLSENLLETSEGPFNSTLHDKQ